MSGLVMRGCCENAIVAAPNRHEAGFALTCPTCGNRVRRCFWGNGWEVVASPRPQDPELLYRAFRKHCDECAPCRGVRQPCPYGEHLLEAWGDAERFYANEQDMIDATWGDEDMYPGSLGAA